MNKRFLVILVAVLVLGILFFKFHSEGPGGEKENILLLGNGTEPKDLDPHLATGVPEHHIITALFEGLVNVDPKTVEPIPGIAKSWDISQDGKVITFHLREEARWSNGDRLTAHDFVYSWRRLLDPKTASQYAYQGYYIKNGRAFNRGELKDASQLGVKAVDDYTLRVELEAPTPFFIGLTYHYSLYPVHRATVEKYQAQWTRPENIVSNGPFVLKEWKLNKIIKLVRNEFYYDKDKVALDGVYFYPIENADSEEKMFRAGKLHVTSTIPLEKVPYWRQDRSGVFYQHPYLGTYFYRLNVTRKPLDDKRVRKALNLAVDREKIVKYVLRGGQVPTVAFTPPGTAGFYPRIEASTSVTEESIRKARQLLAEAGYPGGKGFPVIEILYNTSESHKKLAEAIQQMWKQHLGIEVKLFNQEWKVYLANQRSLNYYIARAGWIGDYNDPNTFLDMFVTGGGNNETGWSNKEYDRLIALAQKTSDQKKRFAYFQRCEEILYEESPIIPIYIYVRQYLKSPEVLGWEPNIMDYHPLKFVSLRGRGKERLSQEKVAGQ